MFTSAFDFEQRDCFPFEKRECDICNDHLPLFVQNTLAYPLFEVNAAQKSSVKNDLGGGFTTHRHSCTYQAALTPKYPPSV
jgi:hypothetical protein